jgi:hypothetical protein
MMYVCSLMYILGYLPSVEASVVFLSAYAVISLWALFRSNQVRVRGAGTRCGCCCCCFGNLRISHYTIVLPIATILELIGFAERREMRLQFGAWSYLFSTMSILIAPVILGKLNTPL